MKCEVKIVVLQFMKIKFKSIIYLFTSKLLCHLMETFSFKVKKDCCSVDENGGPTAPKLRRALDPPENVSEENTSLPDGLSAQHIGQLLTYFHRSFCNEAILGMTVEKTLVCPSIGFKLSCRT